MSTATWLILGLSVLLMSFQAPAQPDELPLLVNRENRLHREYTPEVLAQPQVTPSKPEKAKDIFLIPEAAVALEALFAEAGANGHTLYAVSGYRSYATQSSLYQNKIGQVGQARADLVVAPPGASEHQTGLAMDINGATTLSQGLVEAFGLSPEGLWVKDNAHRFGFIIRYGQDWTPITGYSWEPWHLRYVGIEHATALYLAEVPLETYLEQITLQRALEQLPGWLRQYYEGPHGAPPQTPPGE